jgi:hypothetical protein
MRRWALGEGCWRRENSRGRPPASRERLSWTRKRLSMRRETLSLRRRLPRCAERGGRIDLRLRRWEACLSRRGDGGRRDKSVDRSCEGCFRCSERGCRQGSSGARRDSGHAARTSGGDRSAAGGSRHGRSGPRGAGVEVLAREHRRELGLGMTPRRVIRSGVRPGVRRGRVRVRLASGSIHLPDTASRRGTALKSVR